MVDATIYISHPNSIDFRAALYEPLRRSSLAQTCRLVLPHEVHDDPAAFPTKQIIAEQVDLMVVEASAPSTGSGLELGWADANDVPIVAVHQPGTRVSRSVKMVAADVHEYRNGRDLAATIAAAVAKHC